MTRRPTSILLLAAALALAAARPTAAAPASGWHTLALAATGSHALLYVPAALPAGPAPVVVFLHGQGGTPAGWTSYLQPIADELGLVLLVPKSDAAIGWGVGADDLVLEESLAKLRSSLDVDAARLGIAGFSAGAAYAIEYAYSVRSPFVAVFAHSSPYRTVVRLADPLGPPPLRLHYGGEDPNHVSGAGALIAQMLSGRGVAVETEVAAGYDHSTWEPDSFRDGFAFLVGQRPPACLPAPNALCLRGGRFRVEASWSTGASGGAAQGLELTEESGAFWFFSPGNLELDVKVLDGCALNDRFWVFAAGLTNVATTITVTDTHRGVSKTYERVAGPAFQPIQDTSALATCP